MRKVIIHALVSVAVIAVVHIGTSCAEDSGQEKVPEGVSSDIELLNNMYRERSRTPTAPAEPVREPESPSHRSASSPSKSRVAAPAPGEMILSGDEIDILIDQLVEGDPQAREKLAAAGAPAVDPLAYLLDGKDPEVRIAAIELLGKIGDTRAVEPLIDCLGDPSSRIRVAAAQALGLLGGPLAVEGLIDSLGDRTLNVTTVSTRALKGLGGAVVPSLLDALEDRRDNVRRYAAEILGELEDPAAVEPLTGLLLDDSAWFVRVSAAKALGMLGDREASDALIEALDDGVTNVVGAAAYALALMKERRAAETMIDRMRSS